MRDEEQRREEKRREDTIRFSVFLFVAFFSSHDQGFGKEMFGVRWTTLESSF